MIIVQPELLRQDSDLGRFRSGPVLIFQSHAAAGERGVILEAGRVDQRVDDELVAGGECRMEHESLNQAEEGQRAPGVVAVPARVERQPDRAAALVGTKEHEARQMVDAVPDVERLGGRCKQAVGMFRQVVKRMEEPLELLLGLAGTEDNGRQGIADRRSAGR